MQRTLATAQARSLLFQTSIDSQQTSMCEPCPEFTLKGTRNGMQVAISGGRNMPFSQSAKFVLKM
jgi:hypothetical protein